MSNTETLRFQTPEIQVDPSFWRWLTDYKLTYQRLSTAPTKITAFEVSRTGVIYLPHQDELPSYRLSVADKYAREYCGTLNNLNTIEDFLAFDRKGAVESLATLIDENPYQFLLVAFSDLKNYKFTFNCAVPVYAASPPLTGVTKSVPLPWSARSSLHQQYRRDEESVVAENRQWSLNAGWVKFGSSVTKVVDLKELMDPSEIAQQAVTLNIQLMKWRIVPELNYENFASRKFLLLGAGTLGCAVARGLIAWGVKKITFVDNGKVSFSNPVRQSLFTFEDARSGLSKAPTAARRLSEITPGLQVEGLELEIPMPSHENGNCISEFDRLQKLIAEHDIILLLTDSRESRYFPSVACAASGKLAVSVALGFDSFLIKLQKPEVSACYFCNDVAAPNDSTSHRSLDLQCTVTRPGISSIASNLAIEVLAALITNGDSNSEQSDFSIDASASTLGGTPDQIRGFLADFKLVPSITEPSTHCICCSKLILDAFRADSFNFVLRATRDPSFLEDLSQLRTVHNNIDLNSVLTFDDEEEIIE